MPIATRIAAGTPAATCVDTGKGHLMTPEELAAIGADSRTALAHRDRAIVQAHDAGMSLRAIAEAVGMSHMGVKRIIDRQGA